MYMETETPSQDLVLPIQSILLSEVVGSKNIKGFGNQGLVF